MEKELNQLISKRENLRTKLKTLKKGTIEHYNGITFLAGINRKIQIKRQHINGNIYYTP